MRSFFVHSTTKPLRNHEDGGISGKFQQRQLTEALHRVYLVAGQGIRFVGGGGTRDDSRCAEDATCSSTRNLVQRATASFSFLTSFRRTLHHQSPPYPTAFTGNEKRRYPDGRFNFPAGFIRPIYPSSITRPIKNDRGARAFVRIHHLVDPFIIFTARFLMIPPPCKGKHRDGHDSRSFLEKEEQERGKRNIESYQLKASPFPFHLLIYPLYLSNEPRQRGVPPF